MSLKNYFFRLRLLLTSNPLSVTKLWRDLGYKIGENTLIYHDVVLSGNGKEPIEIGNNCVLTGCTLIAHDASTNKFLGLKYGEKSPSLPIIIEDDCFIGYQSIILMGVTIGKGSIVGAGAVVSKDVPPNSVVSGNPAKVICSVDHLVEKRRNLFITKEIP